MGSTVSELGLANYPNIKPIAKTRFTMCLEEPLKTLSASPDVNCILLCGIEAHVCIQQTAIDLRSKGFEVFVVVDACSSRGRAERYDLKDSNMAGVAFRIFQFLSCFIVAESTRMNS